MATAAFSFLPSELRARATNPETYPVRLGGPVPGNFNDPAVWIKAVKVLQYTAAYCPLQSGAQADLIRAFRDEAKRNKIIIAEVGSWCNTLDPDDKKRKEALKNNIDSLRLADEIGAR